MNREAVYLALFNKLSAIKGIKTSSRILLHWADVSPNQQPALFQAQVSQTAQQVTGFPTKYILTAKVWVYTHRDTNGVIPITQLNNILDLIDNALKPTSSPTNKQTLGGLVEHCWIDGSIETDEGTLGNQSIAIVPISILITS